MLFYFWVAVMLAAIIAVPVAIKLSPEVQQMGGGEDEILDDAGAEGFVDESAPADAFGGADSFGTAEPLADDAFEEFQ
ncbi:MAG: hypothetical protein AAF802_22950 [Planctomycetota bacterium]